MIFSAAAAELDRTAAVYEGTCRALQSAAAMSEEYLAHLSAAEASDWDSAAGLAYALLLGVLRGEGNSVGQQTESLAGEAQLIAQDLRDMADQARLIAQAISSIAGTDIAGFAGAEIARRAREAVDDAGALVSFLSDFDGIPGGLHGVVEQIREAAPSGS